MELTEIKFKLTELGLIPEDWEINELNNISNITRLAGYEYSTVWEETLNGEIIALRGFNIGENQIIQKDFVRISNKLSMRLIRSRLFKGDIIYPCVGTIGNAVVIEENDKYHIQQNIAKITPNKKVLVSKYLAYYLMSSFGLNEIKKFNGSSSQPNILVGSLRKYSIISPPLHEQKAIAHVLSDTDNLIQALENKLVKKRAIKQGAMQQLLTPKEDWEVRKLGEVCDILDNLRVPLNSEQRLKMKGDIPYCGANGIVDYVNDYVIDDEIILMAEDGGYFDEYRTRPIAYIIKGKCWVNNHAHILKAKSNYFQDFIFYSVVHKNILDFINGGTRAKLNKGDLISIEINIPKSKEEQTHIATILSDMDAEIAQLEKNLNKYKLLKQGLMQELLTGKIRLV